ncbi:indole-3-glycerol phosphate synthase TrpC [Planomicrobium sp. Y74]|uniref:indole-3-glycerol phosphate synthase TrpC n=1 Tax=Planomicrobium sp. Y74 TaxID=2478977 RepID=UPI000EF4A60C|nr:indole-3-glycerol phosphate synthase TrpC [Planomicrobium sp. Y74]RLQ90745.1 indole-3-glycerol phosphate synthase TrpC [Planomicrobium sp. Y74]
MNILNEIIAAKREEVKNYSSAERLSEGEFPTKSRLAERLRQGPGVIAEIKRASPSKGDIRLDVDVAAQAKLYEQAGAAAISVLTDKSYFKGSIEDLENVAQLVSVPVLCKDFIVDEIQIDRAKGAGATIILLIVAALGQEELERLFLYAQAQELEVLVEVHDPAELQVAVDLGAELIGVNNRNLKTFEVSLQQTAEIAEHFPADSNSLLISESGIFTERDAAFAFGKGAAGILVGEALMRSEDAGAWIAAVTLPEVKK